MKMKFFTYALLSTIFFLAGCSTHSEHSSNRQARFHTPRNWKQPIVAKQNTQKSSTFHPNFSDRSAEKGSSTKFTPVFNHQQPVANVAAIKKQPSTNQAPRREQMDGFASWYGPGFHGKLTANGESYNQNAMTAAHKILPMNTKIRVTNLENGRSVVVRINDRGPYKKNRILDMTKKGAALLGFRDQGTARVRLDILSFPASYDPSKGLKPYKQTVIQLAVFKNKQRAGLFKNQLAKRYHSLNFLVDQHQSGSFHVVAGPYNSRDRAKKVARNLKSDGVNSFVRSYKK